MSVSKNSGVPYGASYFDYHGIEPGAYYPPMPYRQELGSPGVLLPRSSSSGGGGGTLTSKSKRSFASRLANQIDKLTGGGTIRNTQHHHNSRPLLQDVFRDQPHLTTPRRRAYRNVVPGKFGGGGGRVYIAPPHHPTNSPYNYYNPWDNSQQQQHYIHQQQQQQPLRRTHSDESISIRGEEKSKGNSTWYDNVQEEPQQDSGEDLAYAEVDYIYSFGSRKPPLPYGYNYNTFSQRHHRHHSAHPVRVRDHQIQHQVRRRSPEVRMIRQSQAVVVDTPPEPVVSHRGRRHRSRESPRAASPPPQNKNVSNVDVSRRSRNGGSVVYVGRQDIAKEAVSSPRKSSSNSESNQSNRISDNSRMSHNKNNTKKPIQGSSGSEPFTEDETTTDGEDEDVNETSRKDSFTDEDDFDEEEEEVPKREQSLSPKIVPPPRLVKLRKRQQQQKQQQQQEEYQSCLAQLDKTLDEEGSDYDADISQLESPVKVKTEASPRYAEHLSPQRRLNKNVLSQESIPEEENEELEHDQRSGSGSRTATMRKRVIDRSRLGRLLLMEEKLTKSEQLEQRRRQLMSKSDNSLADDDQMSAGSSKRERTSGGSISRGFSSEIFREVYGGTPESGKETPSSNPQPPRNRATRRNSIVTIGDNTNNNNDNNNDNNNSFMMFHDTTRLRLQIPRPTARDAFNNNNNNGRSRHEVSRSRGLSQSFKERMASSPVRPKDPPPPPPAAIAESSQNLASSSSRRMLPPAPKRSQTVQERIYDIAEHDDSKESKPKLVQSSSSGFLSGSLKRLRRHSKVKVEKPPRSQSTSKLTPERSKSFAAKVRAQSNVCFNSLDRGAIRKKNKSEKDGSDEHIYEEIPADLRQRPLPPVPKSEVVIVNTNYEDDDRSSDSPVKSIFEGATKYDILHYLEDAKERGFTDVEEFDDFDDDDDEDDEILVTVVGGHVVNSTRRKSRQQNPNDEMKPLAVSMSAPNVGATRLQISDRNHANRVSGSSSGSSNGSSARMLAVGSGSKLVDIERNDSGLGSETSKARITLRQNQTGVVRKSSSSARRGSYRNRILVNSGGLNQQNICEDCDQPITDENSEKDSEINYDPSTQSVSTCLPCARRRCERKEIVSEMFETERKYGRDLAIIRDEFMRPMQVAGLLSKEQLEGVFLNVEELVRANAMLTESLKDAIEIALDDGDDDLCSVCLGRTFLVAAHDANMLNAFKQYCTRHGSASALLASLEKEKELLRIFLRVSQMENAILRRMNLSSFLMVPVQRVTKYPLLLSRLLKVTPSHHPDRPALQEARERVEHHLEHMNQEARENAANGAGRLWRRISLMSVSGYKKQLEMAGQIGDVLGNTTWGIRKMVLDVLNWTKESQEANLVLESKLLFANISSNEGNSQYTMKMTQVTAILATLGGSADWSRRGGSDWSKRRMLLFGGSSKSDGVRQAALVLFKDKNGKHVLAKDPLYLDKCVVCWEQEWEDCFEVSDFAAKESFMFKSDEVLKTRHWFRTLQQHALTLGGWRRRRNALANIMINGMGINGGQK